MVYPTLVRAPLRPPNPALLRDLRLFVLASPANGARLSPSPFGLDPARFDPLRLGDAPFYDLLARLDAATFGPEGMAMPRWVLYDAAALPSAVIGFGISDDRAPAELRAAIGVPPSYRGLIPCSMYIAIPSLSPGVFIGHNLASIAPRVTGMDLRGLGGLTKAVALEALGAKAQVGVTQWASSALHIHSKMGPLELLTAYTPSHSEPMSLTYRAAIDHDALLRLAGAARVDHGGAPDQWIGGDDRGAMIALQGRIEAGERWVIAGPPEPVEGGGQRVPIRRG